MLPNGILEMSITAPLYNVSGNSTTVVNASGIVKHLSITHYIYFYIFSVMFWGIRNTSLFTTAILNNTVQEM